jgi:hypothetical protein
MKEAAIHPPFRWQDPIVNEDSVSQLALQTSVDQTREALFLPYTSIFR